MPIDLKKNAYVMMDAINAEDIADFPDANLAESLQRLPGVALDRDNGEGRGITVRGLGSDFTRVRLNGLETLSTAAASDSGTSPNRGRGFDFNVFASDLFTSLEVHQDGLGIADEGSLGATVDLVTGKPLDYKGTQARASRWKTRITKTAARTTRALPRLYADQWFDNTRRRFVFGRLQRTHFGGRSLQAAGRPVRLRISQFDLCGHTADSARAASPPPTAPRWRGTTATNGVHESGGDRRAVGLGSRRVRGAVSGCSTATPGRFNNSLVRIPALINIEQQDLQQERLGLTGAIQWKPNENTSIGLDMVYSKFDQKSDVNQIQSVGLNRNNTNANFNSRESDGAESPQRAYYQTCASQTALPFREAIDCGGSEAMPGGVFAGLGHHELQHQSEQSRYLRLLQQPAVAGYSGASTGNGMFFRDRIVGRPGVDVLAAHVSRGGKCRLSGAAQCGLALGHRFVVLHDASSSRLRSAGNRTSAIS